MNNEQILTNLTNAQRQAVTHINGPMLVVAGAGSGKTRVVTRRIAFLISQGVNSSQILAMTFTNKAAKEIKERVVELVGIAPRWMGTFHSVCARLLRQDIEKLQDGRDGRFSIYDTDEQKVVLKECLAKLKIDDKPANFQNKISRAKCDLVMPNDYCEVYSGDKSHDIKLVYSMYEKRLRELNAVDFDDLLLLTVHLLEKVPRIRAIYHERFRYLLVDEYQDTNHTQYRLLRLFTSKENNIHVTGDPDQSIYSWRGAEYSNIMNFEHDFVGTKVVRLEQNYRCSKMIIKVSNSLINNNVHRIKKELFTENSDGELLQLRGFNNDKDEAFWVIQEIGKLRSCGENLQDIAIFYRTNAQSRTFEDYFVRAGIPYQIVGGTRFYDRKEIRDILAYLRLLLNPQDDMALKRVLNSRSFGVGKTSMDNFHLQAAGMGISASELLIRSDFIEQYPGRLTKKIRDFIAWFCELRNLKVGLAAETVERVIEHSGLKEYLEKKAEKDPKAEARIENLNSFLQRSYDYQESNPEGKLAEFVEEVSLVADVDSLDQSSACVSLMTLHSSKGLEFPFVFIVGIEEDILPHKNSLESEKSIEEERRLLYVGITRAKQRVWLSWARVRFRWGDLITSQESRFLNELPSSAIDNGENPLKESIQKVAIESPKEPTEDDDELIYEYDETKKNSNDDFAAWTW